VAKEKVNNLLQNPSKIMPGRILPWNPEKDAHEYLHFFGINPKRVQIEVDVRGYDLNNGKWVDLIY